MQREKIICYNAEMRKVRKFMNQNLKNFLKDMAKDPVVTAIVGMWFGTAIMYAAAVADEKNAEKYYEAKCKRNFEQGKLIAKIECRTDSLAKLVEDAVKENEHKKEIEKLKNEIRELKEQQANQKSE